jgi:hypothetical protein
MGVGSPLWIVFSVDVAADITTGDETYILKVQTDDNDAFSSATDLISATILAAALPAGAQHVFALPYNNERFLRAYYDVGGTTPTITISAWLTSEMPRKWAAYPNAVGS